MKPGTITEYRRLLGHTLDALDIAGLRASPSKIGEDEIYFLRDEYYAHLDPVVNRRQIRILGTFLKHYDDNIVEKMHLAWPQGTRSTVKWLSPEQAMLLLDAAEGMELPLIHMELMLCMRRIEVKRMTINDVKWNLIDVLGKGKGEGKWRSIPWAADTVKVLKRYSVLREEMIKKALEHDPTAVIPESFLLYCNYGWKLGAPQDTAIDSMIKKAADRAGIPREEVSNHVLRRTGARACLEAGGSIEDVCTMLGHADTKTTMLYLGITTERLEKLQERVGNYWDSVRLRMKAEPRKAVEYQHPVLIAR